MKLTIEGPAEKLSVTTHEGTTVRATVRRGITSVTLDHPDAQERRIGRVKDGGLELTDFPNANLGPQVLRCIAALIEAME